MPVFVLTVLKIVFLGLLYFFVYRAVRSVVLDLRGGSSQAWVEAAPAAPARRGSRSRSRARAPRSVVVMDEHGAKGDTLRLDGHAQLQIGRADACQIQVSDTYVSSFHARIFDRDGAWYLEDLGSTNGTYLNQRKVTAPAELQAGDRIKLGKTVLELKR